jgi:hypothetical protein
MGFYQTDPLQDPRWAQLVESHPEASVYHTQGWLEALRRTYNYRPIAFTTSAPTGNLENGMVFCRVRSWLTGPRMVSLPFSDHCEPLFDNPEEFGFVISCLQAELDHQDWKYLEMRPIHGSLSGRKAEAAFRATNQYYLHRVDLRPSLSDVFKSLHRDSAQRRIRHAERMGVVCSSGRSPKLLKDFYNLQLLTRVRHHLPPQPYAWFRNLLDCVGSAEIRVAYKDQVPIAAILTLRFRNTCYYKYGCSDRQFKNYGAVPLLLWKAIEASKATGAEGFDLGRSEDDAEGLLNFKDHWTPNRLHLAYWRYPSLDSTGATERWKLRMAKRVFAFMPDKLLAVTGRLVYRHIG